MKITGIIRPGHKYHRSTNVKWYHSTWTKISTAKAGMEARFALPLGQGGGCLPETVAGALIVSALCPPALHKHTHREFNSALTVDARVSNTSTSTTVSDDTQLQ